MEIFITVSLAIFGAALGSYAGALVWRLRASQLKEDKKSGERFSQKEFDRLKKISGVSITKDRSVCLSCGYQLAWYDMIPIFSWLSLRGKCRKCGHFIGYTEILVEVSMALFFALSFVLWPYDLDSFYHIARFVLWLIAGVALAVLFIYDKKWFLLPDIINYVLIAIGVLNAILVVAFASDVAASLLNVVGSVLILSGLYMMIYILSKGTWIGFGDIKLGLGLGLMLSDWSLAFIALFAANLIGCLLVVPQLVTKKLKANSKIPFGPLLILGYAIAGLFGYYIVREFLLISI